MGRPALFQRSDFVKAGLAFVDEGGLENLSLRSLGDRLGASHTAIYSHFRDKEELLAAMLDEMVFEMNLDANVLDALEPREAMRTLALWVRDALLRHPRLLPAFSITNATLQSGPALTTVACRVLERGGVAPSDVPVVYSILESYVIGSSIYDFAGAPDHAASRRTRFRLMGNEAFDEISRTTADVEAHNDRAFHRGLDTLIVGLIPAPVEPHR